MPLAGGKSIRVITAPFFLGTEMEAFRGRAKLDFQASHDLEDLVAVVEGRETLLEEIAASTLSLRRILADAAKMLLPNQDFLTSLLDLSWPTNGFHSSKDALHLLQPIFPERTEIWIALVSGAFCAWINKLLPPA